MPITVSGTTITFNDATTQTTAAVGFPATTAMLFKQTSAPTGWTKLVVLDNYALRVVTGTASTGGSVAFTTAFASGLSAGSTTLSTSQIPSHTHGGVVQPTGGDRVTLYCPSNGTIFNSGTSGSAGSSSSHNHSLPSFAVQYIDVIIATKD